jgi:hypothetical protein
MMVKECSIATCAASATPPPARIMRENKNALKTMRPGETGGSRPVIASRNDHMMM